MAAKALKSSLLSDTGMMKSSHQQGFVDDNMWCVTGLNNVPCDDFSVDDLLDFSDKDFNDGPPKEDEDFKDTLSLSSSHNTHYCKQRVPWHLRWHEPKLLHFPTQKPLI